MDWANERYVRLYVRDSLTWKRLRWAGQTVLMHLLRKFDRAGRMPLDGVPVSEAVCLAIDAPDTEREFVSIGLDKLLGLEVVVVDDGDLLCPNYLKAQSARQSDAARQRESRARRRDLDRTVTDGHTESHAVTPGHTPSQNVTGGHAISSQNVTESHGESHAVTRGHTESLLTLTSSDRAQPAEPADPETSNTYVRNEMPWRAVGAAFNRRYEARTGGPIALDLHRQAFAAVALEAGGDMGKVETALDRFFADPHWSKHNWPPAAFAKQFGRFLHGLREDDEEEQTRVIREARAQACREMGIPID